MWDKHDRAVCLTSDLCLDHVDATRAESFDTVIDVHHAFTLRHVQHDVQHNVAAGTARTHTDTTDREESF